MEYKFSFLLKINTPIYHLWETRAVLRLFRCWAASDTHIRLNKNRKYKIKNNLQRVTLQTNVRHKETESALFEELALSTRGITNHSSQRSSVMFLLSVSSASTSYTCPKIGLQSSPSIPENYTSHTSGSCDPASLT